MFDHASEFSVPPKPAAMPVSWLDSDEGAAMDEEEESEQAQVIKASYTSRLRPHTLVAEGLMDEEEESEQAQVIKASYTSSLRPHTLVASGLIH